MSSIHNLEKSPLNSTDFASLEEFNRLFALSGDKVYEAIFESYQGVISIQKPKFAIANLKKIFETTFAISSVSGFDKMSLRDLSKQTGLSMGAIYSCINKKEDIASMVSKVVQLSSEVTRQYSVQETSLFAQIQSSIRFHLYASMVLQPWYFFLYFETRALPSEQQQKSKNIEIKTIQSYQQLIEEGMRSGVFRECDANMVANIILVLLQDWYLKPWKFQQQKQYKGSKEQRLEMYSNAVLEQLKILLLPV